MKWWVRVDGEWGKRDCVVEKRQRKMTKRKDVTICILAFI